MSAVIIFNPAMILFMFVLVCYWCVLAYERFSPFHFKCVMDPNTEEVVKEKYNNNYHVVSLEDWRLLSFKAAKNIIKGISADGNNNPFKHCTINGFRESPSSVYFVFKSEFEDNKWTCFIENCIKEAKSNLAKEEKKITWSLV